MMSIHKEGTATILITLIVLCFINFAVFYWLKPVFFIKLVLPTVSLMFFVFILSFFRYPDIKPVLDEHGIVAPADGKIVVIEETIENEYFKDKRLQISIFMSPLNVHINWFPVAGEVIYYKYHPGAHLVAWHPKSSIENEHSTVVIRTSNGTEVLVKQIAGAVARRVVCYAENGKQVNQGDQLGFIKFGSRVDILLPIGTQPNVVLDQIVNGRQTIIAQY